MIVETMQGPVQGIQVNGHIEFRGIPYAKAPTGELRWKPPVAPSYHDDVYVADTFQCRAIQSLKNINQFYHKEFYNHEDITTTSEDCLYLNIYTKDINKQNKKPVAFWIQGGAFSIGSGDELPFDGTRYTQEDIILVTFNYRLGVFGFLACEELLKESNTTGNYGLLDMTMALKWVYENIDNFGGDSNNITVFGQSVGAMSIEYLLCSPYANPYISKCIMQSGAGYYSPFMGVQPTLEDNSLEVGKMFLEKLGVETIDEARKIDWKRIFDVQNEMEVCIDGGLKPFIPTIDHTFITMSCNEAIEQNKIKKVPTILGSNSNEMNMKYITKAMIQSTSDFALKAHENGNDDVYCYLFARELPGDEAGAFHSAELWYTFHTLDKCWRPFEESDFELSNQIIKYWTNFMKTGNPNSKDLPSWPKYYKGNEHKIFDI